jgi:rRNA maturation RNase YbeY
LKVEFQLLGARSMRKLNLQYRGKDSATDVLSFPAPPVFRRQGLLGELVICTPVARRQAREYGHSLGRELEVLIVHGLLHLQGYDHEEGPREALRMKRAEARLLFKAFGRRTPGLIGRHGSGIS